MSIEIVPLDAPLGAEILGVDMRETMTPDTVEAVRSAWHKHLILLFRGQDISDVQHFAFTRQLGPTAHRADQLLSIARKEMGEDEREPDIAVISNIKENGKAIGSLGDGEAYWHSDSSFVEVPPAGSMLRAVEVPDNGGNTSFMNMYLALETLPADLRAQIEGKSSKHDPTFTSAGERRKEYADTDDPSESPGPVHPLICTHPDSGRKSLFLGRRANSYIVGLPLAESEILLNKLWAHAMEGDFAYEHMWRVGDVILWDNRCTMHRRDAFAPNARRMMRRTQLAGTRPS